MAQPYTVQFGPWLPDGADLAYTMPFQYSASPIPCADVLNVYYGMGAYRSLNSFAATSAALASQALGAFTALDSSGNPQIYVASGADLFHLSGSSWVNVSKSAGAYTGAAHWSFASFGGCIVGADGIHALQDMTIGGSAFADVSAAPIGNVLGVIGQFLIIGDITTPTAYPYRVQWSGIGDLTNWPTPLTDAAIAAQSGYQDLDQDFGEVMFIGNGPLMGVILQRHGITRASYQGGDAVFSFMPYERKRGVISRSAAVQVGAVTHFISDDGFHMTDGTQVVPTGTGTDGGGIIDKWFWSNVNTNALSAIHAAYDASLQNVIYAIPTGTNTLPDTLLLFNTKSGRWGRAAISSEFLFTDNDGTRHRLGVIDQTHKLGYLTGSPALGYCESYDVGFVDGAQRFVSGVRINAVTSDTPIARVGVKNSPSDATQYSADASMDQFSRIAPVMASGNLMRARVSSKGAAALFGATLYMEQGGGA